MAELIVTKIKSENSHTALADFISKKAFIPLFFFSPYSLNTWLHNDSKDLCIAKLGDEELLIVYTEKDADMRVLFENPSKEMIEAIQQKIKPKFLAVNESYTKPDVNSFYSDTEYQLMVDPIANLEDKGIRKKYNRARRNNGELTYQPYTPEHASGIFEFLHKWNTTRSEELNRFAKTHNDTRFLELYKDDPALIGGVVLDQGKVVGYRLGIETYDGNILALFNKVLRGYTELGAFMYVEGMKQLQSRGFISAYIGPANNDFKRQFLKDATTHEVYSYIIHNEYELKDEGKYLMRFF